MKKRLISLVIVLLVAVLALTSCDEIVDKVLGSIDQSLVEELQKKLEEKDEEIYELKDEITALKNQISTLQAEITALEFKDAENKNKIAALEADYAAKVAELEANKQANADALAALKAEYDAEIETLEAENAKLDLQIEALEEQIQDLLNDNDYIVTFDVNGGVGDIPNQTVRYKKTVDEPVAPTKEHYDFIGWYVNGEKVEFPYVVTADTDFVAQYSPTKYTITYNANGGTMPENYVTEYDVETPAILPTPTRDLYLFDGWYENADFSGAKVTSISTGDFGNKTYYAKWLSTNGITYRLSYGIAYYIVTGYNGSDTAVVIPSSVDGIPVKEIADDAFKGKYRITSITVPDSVTSIGSYAFSYCGSLTELNLGNGIETIPFCMAYRCNKLESIVIPDSVTSIGWQAFEDCDSLTSVVIGDSVTYIGQHAFDNCSSLTSVVIPDSVTSIDDYAFAGCSSLISVVIPDSVTSIGYGAFENCSSLTSVVIGDSVTSIGSYAFAGCSKLREVHNYSDLLIEKGSIKNGHVGYYATVVVNH